MRIMSGDHSAHAPPSEPHSPMWLPALGVALLAAAGVYWATSAPLKAVDESALETASAEPSASAAPAAQPAPSARPQAGNEGQRPGQPSGPSKQLPKGILDLIKH